jgi:hypothetical protein
MNGKSSLTRLLVFGLLLSLALIPATQVAAQQATPGKVPGLAAPIQPTIQFNMSSVPSATGSNMITVNGSGARPNLPVSVALVARANILGPAISSVTVQPNAQGDYTAILSVPSGDMSTGYVIRSEQINPPTGHVLQYWWESLTAGNLIPSTTVPSVAPQPTTPPSTAPQSTTPQSTAPSGY